MFNHFLLASPSIQEKGRSREVASREQSQRNNQRSGGSLNRQKQCPSTERALAP